MKIDPHYQWQLANLYGHGTSTSEMDRWTERQYYDGVTTLCTLHGKNETYCQKRNTDNDEVHKEMKISKK